MKSPGVTGPPSCHRSFVLIKKSSIFDLLFENRKGYFWLADLGLIEEKCSAQPWLCDESKTKEEHFQATICSSSPSHWFESTKQFPCIAQPKVNNQLMSCRFCIKINLMVCLPRNCKEEMVHICLMKVNKPETLADNLSSSPSCLFETTEDFSLKQKSTISKCNANSASGYSAWCF